MASSWAISQMFLPRSAALALRQPAAAQRLREFLQPSRPLASVARGLRPSGSWQNVIAALTPAHCAAMTPDQMMAVLNLCKLDPAFKSSLPRSSFAMVANAAADSDLQQWQTAELAELLTCCRAGELHTSPATATAVTAIEQHLLSRDLTALPLPVVADVFSSFLGAVASSSPAVVRLAQELTRRAGTLGATAAAQPAVARPGEATTEPTSRSPAVLPVRPTCPAPADRGGLQDLQALSLQQQVPGNTGPGPDRMRDAVQREHKVKAQPIEAPSPAPMPSPASPIDPLSLAPTLRPLSSLDEVVQAVERAVEAVLEVEGRQAGAGAAGGEGGGAESTQQRAARLVRAEETIDALRAIAIQELLRRAAEAQGSSGGGRGAGDGEGRGNSAEEGQQSGRRYAKLYAAAGGARTDAGSGSGNSSGGSGSGSGSGKRHDWRKRAADSTMLAAGVGAVLTVGAVVSGLQASQLPAPSHRLVAALERASPSTFLHIVRYVAGPFPVLGGGGVGGERGTGQDVNLTALLRADVTAQRHGTDASSTHAEDGLATAILHSSLQRSSFTSPTGPGPGQAHTTVAGEARGDTAGNQGAGRVGPRTGRAGLDDAAAATIVAAARRALTRTGLTSFSPAQLVALVELMSAENSPVVGLLDAGMAGDGAVPTNVPPSPFWDAVLQAAVSRPAHAYSVEQRISLAYRFARIHRLAGARYGFRAQQYAPAAAALIRSLLTHGAAEGVEDGGQVLMDRLSSSPALVARLAFAASVCDCADAQLSATVAEALSLAAAAEDTGPLLSDAVTADTAPVSPALSSLASQALWAILLLYDKGGVLPRRDTCPGGSAEDVIHALQARGAQDTVQSAPLLAITLLAQRGLAGHGTMSTPAAGPGHVAAIDRGVQEQMQGRAQASAAAEERIWDLVPPSFVDGMWSFLLPALSKASGQGFHALSPSLSSSSASAGSGTGAHGEEAAVPKPPPAFLAPGYGSSHPGAAPVDPVVAAVTARRFGLLMAASQQLDLPSARTALLLISDGLAAAGSALTTGNKAGASTADGEGAAISGLATATGGALSAHPFAIANVATTVATVGRALGTSASAGIMPPGAGEGVGRDDDTRSGADAVAGVRHDRDMRLVYGRCLTLLAQQLQASYLLAPLRLMSGGGGAGGAGMGSQGSVSKGNGAHSGVASQHSGMYRSASSSLRRADLDLLSMLWLRLLEADATVQGLLGQGQGQGQVQGAGMGNEGKTGPGLDPLSMSWPAPSLERFRRSLSAGCQSLACEVAHRLATLPTPLAQAREAQVQVQEGGLRAMGISVGAALARSGMPPAAPAATADSLPSSASACAPIGPSLSPELHARLALCVTLSHSLAPTAGHGVDGFDPSEDVLLAHGGSSSTSAPATAATTATAAAACLSQDLQDASDSVSAVSVMALADIATRLQGLAGEGRARAVHGTKASTPAQPVVPLAGVSGGPGVPGGARGVGGVRARAGASAGKGPLPGMDMDGGSRVNRMY